MRFGKYVLLIATASAITAACLGFSFSSETNEKYPDAITAVVSRGPVDEVVLALGTLEPSSMVRVGAQVTGQINAVHVQVGQTVNAGDLLADFDAVPQTNALKIAEAKLEGVKAQRDVKRIEIRYAESAFKRQRSLSKHDAVSRTAFEEAEARFQTLSAELASLEAQIKESQVDLQTAEANLAYTRITAPMKGTVVVVPVERGQTLNSAQSSPTVAIIANLSEMQVKIRISEADVWRTKPGQSAWFTIVGDPQTRYEGTLEAIEFAPPSLANDPRQESATEAAKDGGAVYYNGVLRVKNPEGKLRTKMTAQVRISVGGAEDALLVPWGALSSRQGDGSYLVKIRTDDGRVIERPVRIGYSNGINAQVVSGLQLGEVVLLQTSNEMKAN
jgi:macrolide-specific efflux system membrane fusion protein